MVNADCGFETAAPGKYGRSKVNETNRPIYRWLRRVIDFIAAR